VIVDLARAFLTDPILPGVAPCVLWTRRPGLEAKLNEGPYSERRWAAAVPKLIAGEYGVLYIQAADPGRADRTAHLSVVVNPTCGADTHVDAEIELSCSLPYARELCRAPERIARPPHRAARQRRRAPRRHAEPAA
jgi:hypothetical protein